MSPRRRRSPLPAALLVAAGTLLGVLAHQSLASSSSSAAPFTDVPRADTVPSADGLGAGPPDRPAPTLRLGLADGLVPDDVTVFEDDVPAVARLDPALLRALRRAAVAAAEDDVEILVNSGWRSPTYQEQLLEEAVAEHGSRAEAARWVATPETSAHVSGDAVDVGPSEATAWLADHGAGYGLCRTYRNEPWHYELRPDAVAGGCPRPYPDPTHDPRMRG